MNYRRGSLISGVLLLIFLLLIPLAHRLGRTETGAVQTVREIQLIDEHVGDIAAVAINHGKIRFGLLHQPPQILLEPALPGADLSQEEMQSFLYRISKLTAMGTVRRREELAAYGLDPPRALCTVILRNGDKIRLALGDVNPVGDSSYLLKEGSDDIYLISELDAALLTAVPDDFRDRRVLPALEMEELNLIRRISLDYESPDHEDFAIVNTNDFEFRLTEPFETSLDYESVLSEMVFPLLSLNPKRVAAVQELPGPPGFRLTVLIGDENYNLLFRRGEESWFILREDLGKVYEVPADEVPWGDLRYRDLLNGSVYHVNISRIDRIEIRGRGETYSLELSGRSTELKGSLNGRDLEYPEVMDLYSTLFETGIAGIVHGTEAAGRIAGRDPDLALTVFKTTGAIDTLEFYILDEDESLAAINGKVDFTVYNRFLQALLQKLSSTAS